MLKKSRSTSAPTGGTSSGPSFAMVGEVVCEMLIPALMGLLVDNGIYQSDPSYVTHLDVLMLLVAVGGFFFGCAGSYFASKASAGLAKNLRREMFVNIQKFSFANIDRFSTAGLVTSMTPPHKGTGLE
ncbi:MAG: ABC transporter transmembrane domain-containing protein [Lachnospiraceae bacterium]|nr:hypothetical protein [Lachnospiraceae bacterium]MCI1399131.1 ABC transporter transmembrane domain-containing protein [Lachnospiraceae bacterium]MCI1425009.1 ABC transporter transmembrane domain-containing protein [Lachnospiraceae bacterium]MCI1453700.1 ABC transporter transmembrane domain-containing protein [Lachnospiraceae bacterium]